MIWDELAANPWMQVAAGFGLLFAVAGLADWLTKHVLLRAIRRALKFVPSEAISKNLSAVVGRFAHIVPALVLYQGIVLVPQLPDWVTSLVANVAAAFIIFSMVFALSGALNLVNDLYQRRPEARTRPIKGYIQVVRIIVYAAGIVLVVAVLIGRSPVILLSGLGAMAAVLMLVFKDTILSLVASVQLTSNDMIRVGDWIEMPALNADGDVIDIALHTVKVQNWDKTITTIPTYRLIAESFKNWRGMQESGGRRIKRALYIDLTSIRFLGPKELDKLRRVSLIDEYLARKKQEIEKWNAALAEGGKDPVNTRRVTNIGTFRAYALSYLRAHSQINQNMTLLVRQLAPGAQGLPLEIYCFTATTAWAAYEDIQSDIFDHLIAIMPSFHLRQFQEESTWSAALAIEKYPVAYSDAAVEDGGGAA